MRLKAISAATSAEAMQKVRDELGPDAMILATEPEPDGSVRIIAALEDEPAPSPARPSAGKPAPRATAPRPDGDSALAQLMEFHGAPEALSTILQRGPAGNDAIATLALRLEGALQFASLTERGNNVPLMFVGLPGAGKTLAAAKLAARTIMAGGPVRLITTDARSAGAMEQIAAFATPLKLEIETADTPARLAAVVAKRRVPDAQIIIDTQGVNPFDENEMAALGALASAAKAEPVFVMAAGGAADEAADQAASFAQIGCRRLLTTKIDTARRLGGMLAAAGGNRLALAEISASPMVAEGLQALNALALARLLIADRRIRSAS